ncbi:MAG: VWA domain-containing protein [Dehalococcoidia bacterium]
MSGVNWQAVEFATPLVLLALVPVVGVLASLFLQERPSTVVADAGPLAAATRATRRSRLRRLPDVIRALAILLLVLAAARPREGLAVTSLPEEGIDIVAVVDVSSSMTQAASREETRLQAARRVLDEFAETLEGDRLGLVAFQARALTLSPLTNDVAAIQRRIEELGPGLVEDGTAIGLGITEAVGLLEESQARSRVLVLLTDGENNAGEIEPFAAARVAEALEIRVYTIGLTGAGSAEVDVPALEEMAELTGGAYFDAQTPAELEAAYEEIGALERSRVGEREFVSWREYGPWLAFLAAGLVLGELALRSTWLRRHP